ncbi:MAG TPA: Fe-S cluster assembly protein SufD [Mycobacteriales bacterium]|nr:Fe-S cluster assembly protein SufD [Mycobacteriales bacterium]
MADQTHSHGVTDDTGSPDPDRTLTKRVYSLDPETFGVPTGREEEWRFTPLDRLRELIKPVVPDGTVVLDVQAAPEVQTRYVDRTDPLFGAVLTPQDRVSALAMAAVEQALVVSVPRNAVANTPTYLTMRGEGGTWYSHLIVDVAEGAEALVVIDHVGSATLAANVELRVGDGAGLTVLFLQDWDDDAVHVEAQAAWLGRDARLRHIVVTLGGDLVRISPTIRFGGPGGEAELLGLYFTDATQHQEHRMFVDHGVPRCRSRVTYKGALQGEDAHAVWIGDVLIRPGATGTDTYEVNRNLVLTDGARADSVPNLEITTGEILGAGHASATGRFDDLQLFYLMARGIPEGEARRMVVRAFFADVIQRIGLPTVEERLTAAIEDELARVGA